MTGKGNVQVGPENREKINALIKMCDSNPEKYPRFISSQDDAVTELVRVYELHNGAIQVPTIPACMKGPLKSITLIGAEGL